jgi:hypothetical protein
MINTSDKAKAEEYISSVQKEKEKQQLNSRKHIIQDSLRDVEAEKLDLLLELTKIETQLKEINIKGE